MNLKIECEVKSSKYDNKQSIKIYSIDDDVFSIGLSINGESAIILSKDLIDAIEAVNKATKATRTTKPYNQLYAPGTR